MPKKQKSAGDAAEVAAESVVELTPAEAVTPEPPVASEVPKDPPVAGGVKVRLLRDSEYGACNDVALIDAALVESLAGVVDADPAAVEYAESLK